MRYHVKRLSRNAYILYISDISNTFLQFKFFNKTIYATYLMEHGSFILHSSTIVRDGKAVLFAGKENHGKSTIVKLLPEYRVLNDDFAIIGKKSDNQYFVHTSPFYEKNSFLKIYQEVLIGKILFLEKSKIVSVKNIRRSESVIRLASLMLSPLSFIPKYWEGMPPTYSRRLSKHMFTLIEDFSKHVSCQILQFPKNRSFLPYI